MSRCCFRFFVCSTPTSDVYTDIHTLPHHDTFPLLAALKAHRKSLIYPKVEQYHGRTIKLMGDGALMEFASVVDAVTFAVDVQCSMLERNAEVPTERRIAYRIGINIGDVIVEGGDIYGDGVNVAADRKSTRLNSSP